jgi:hypothetical protein
MLALLLKNCLFIYLFIYLLLILEFERQVSHLLGRHATT